MLSGGLGCAVAARKQPFLDHVHGPNAAQDDLRCFELLEPKPAIATELRFTLQTLLEAS